MKTQEKIKQAAKEYIELHGYAPTFREIGAAVGASSSATAKKYVSQLLVEGELETDHPSSARALRIPGMRWIDTGKYTAVVKQLEALRCHCLEMAREPNSAGDWGRGKKGN